MKKREKFLVAFFISIILGLIICTVTTFVERRLDESIMSNIEQEIYNQENIDNYTKVLKQYIENNYEKDYKQLAINIIVNENNMIRYDETIIEGTANILKEYIEENYGGNYNELADKILKQQVKSKQQEYIEETTADFTSAMELFFYLVQTSIELLIIIYSIINVEFENIKQYIKENIKLILIFIIYSMIMYGIYEISHILSNNYTINEYWNNTLKLNVGNIYYWLNNIMPSQIIVYWLIFIIGNLLKNNKNIKNYKE